MSAEPWDRMEGEPRNWYERFRNYYLPQEPGVRTMQEAWVRFRDASDGRYTSPKPNADWYKNEKRWQWAERANTHDLKKRDALAVYEEENKRQMIDRHLRGLQTVFDKAHQYLKDNDFKNAGDALNALKLAITEERRAHGLPSHLLEVQHLTDEQLLTRYRELIEAIGGAGGRNDQAGDVPAKIIEADFSEPNEQPAY